MRSRASVLSAVESWLTIPAIPHIIPPCRRKSKQFGFQRGPEGTGFFASGHENLALAHTGSTYATVIQAGRWVRSNLVQQMGKSFHRVGESLLFSWDLQEAGAFDLSIGLCPSIRPFTCK